MNVHFLMPIYSSHEFYVYNNPRETWALYNFCLTFCTLSTVLGEICEGALGNVAFDKGLESLAASSDHDLAKESA